MLAAAVVAGGQEALRLEVLARVHLRDIQSGAPVARAYMGAGITVRVKRSTDGFVMGEVLTVTAGHAMLYEGEGGIFDTAALYRYEGAYHLVVTEYTGGAHCCGQYQVFSRAAGGPAWRHLGITSAENGGPSPAWDVIVEKDGSLYLEEMDNRFDYFHACHACSLLVNLGPQYSLLTSEGFEPANDVFRDPYARMAAATDAEIAAEVRRRTARPRSILDQSTDFAAASFSDDLGQLLVKRTIFLLRAGQEEHAWQTFAEDVSKYYQASDRVDLLKKEIIETLRQ